MYNKLTKKSKIKDNILSTCKKYIKKVFLNQKALINDLELNFLVFYMGQKCTLRCKHCCNLIPYIPQSHFYGPHILNDLKKILRVVKIHKLQIQGGEPLTNLSELHYVLKEVVKMDIHFVSITTNGTLLFDKKTLGFLKNNTRVEIVISDYPQCAELRKNLLKQLDSNNIKYTIYKFLFNENVWFNSGGPMEIKNQNDHIVQKIYNECVNKICLSLINGKLYQCGKIDSLKKLHNDYEVNVFDEVDVRNTDLKMLKNDINSFINNKNFRQHCRYCLGTNFLEKVKPAIQLKEKE